nr:hypothetical protein [Thioalkalivibrio sp.]
MAEPIPDFIQDEHHAVTRTLLERCLYWPLAHANGFQGLPRGLSAVTHGGKRVVNP